MAPTASIRIDKSMPFRGGTKVWSNRYHFTGANVPDSAHWSVLANAIITAEKTCFQSNVEFVRAVGYDAGSDIPVWDDTYAVAGTGTTIPTGTGCPGNTAAMVRYTTAARTSRNHPVYLFNWYHAVHYSDSGDPDTLNEEQKSLLETYVGQWVGAGFSDGTTDRFRAGPNGASATDVVVNAFTRHRDFPT